MNCNNSLGFSTNKDRLNIEIKEQEKDIKNLKKKAKRNINMKRTTTKLEENARLELGKFVLY